jgi:hypothetical protein
MCVVFILIKVNARKRPAPAAVGIKAFQQSDRSLDLGPAGKSQRQGHTLLQNVTTLCCARKLYNKYMRCCKWSVCCNPLAPNHMPEGVLMHVFTNLPMSMPYSLHFYLLSPNRLLWPLRWQM